MDNVDIFHFRDNQCLPRVDNQLFYPPLLLCERYVVPRNLQFSILFLGQGEHLYLC